MFIGEYSHTIDTKNRLAFPSRLRGELGSRAVLTRGLDKCLFVYPLIVWEKIAKSMGSFPIGDPETRSFVRLFLAGAADVEVDGQGRILLPEYLRRYAELERNVTVTGLYDRVEIWDEKRWNTYREDAEKNTDGIAKKLGELGLY
ncbi:MAG: division/cell wall cluster transcriptional repressor MraZ [Candidatus Moraniibacteriota bacterium]|nr:MAG: division/cell wall cluster transcriptional repressor MraZ [Candidatus Moranbacteria bacterium]